MTRSRLRGVDYVAKSVPEKTLKPYASELKIDAEWLADELKPCESGSRHARSRCLCRAIPTASARFAAPSAENMIDSCRLVEIKDKLNSVAISVLVSPRTTEPRMFIWRSVSLGGGGSFSMNFSKERIRHVSN